MSRSSPVVHQWAQPVRGDVVQTTTGIRLGHVISVKPGEFQVRLGHKTRWLSRDAIFTAYNGRVTLVCESEGLLLYTTLD